ncbi:hypothetical protein [Thermomonas flagellata]|uniref:hypothetical protein n=1 Tax=Thermomonas flagellata TaxID=2888524 RepID=UPI001F04DB03|nr:hypothetical protein [Thermomonas flagellata]
MPTSHCIASSRRAALLAPLALAVVGLFAAGSAAAQSVGTPINPGTPQQVTIKEKSSTTRCQPWPSCKEPHFPMQARVPAQTPPDEPPGPKHTIHPVPAPPPRPRTVDPTPVVTPGVGHLPRDPGMGNGEVMPNPGGNPVEPALPCPPGFQLLHLKNGKTTCAKAEPAPTPAAPTARQVASGQGHVQVCPPYCGNQGPMGKPADAHNGGVMGPAGSPVPRAASGGKMTKADASRSQPSPTDEK